MRVAILRASFADQVDEFGCEDEDREFCAPIMELLGFAPSDGRFYYHGHDKKTNEKASCSACLQDSLLLESV